MATWRVRVMFSCSFPPVISRALGKKREAEKCQFGLEPGSPEDAVHYIDYPPPFMVLRGAYLLPSYVCPCNIAKNCTCLWWFKCSGNCWDVSFSLCLARDPCKVQYFCFFSSDGENKRYSFSICWAPLKLLFLHAFSTLQNIKLAETKETVKQQLWINKA